MTIHCRVIAFWSADTARDLVTLTFDLEQLSYMAGHVTNLATKYLHTWWQGWSRDPPCMTIVHMPILCLSVLELWVITFAVGYHWKCVRGHCACAESRDPWVAGEKRFHFWNPRPRFAYLLCTFYWATTTIKGRLLSSVTNAKALDCVKFLCVTLWPWPLTF